MMGEIIKLKFKIQVFLVKLNKKVTNFFSLEKVNCRNQKY